MKVNWKKTTVAIAMALAAATHAAAKDFQPEYVGGYPTKETALAMFDEYDYQAATQFYVWAYPYLNGLGMEKGFARMGGNNRSWYVFDKLMQPQHVVMTANTQVVYNWTRLIDVSNEPAVIVVPPKTRGHFYDIGMRAYADTGDIGADKGRGGKYLLVSRDYDGEIPEGYFVVRAKYSNLVTYAFRSFPGAEGGLDGAVERGKQGKWYYLMEADNPPENTRVLIGDKPFYADWIKDERAFEWLAEAFNRDRVPESAKAHLGNMRRLGMLKGQPFNPDARAKKILKRAAKTGEAMVKSMAFRSRFGGKFFEDRQHVPTFVNKSSTFFVDDYEEVEARAGQWHELVGNFAMTMHNIPGKGAAYMNTYWDADGNDLMGQNTYKLTMPAEVPVAQFWQIPVYEVATRSIINTDQKRATRSGTDNLRKNADGSVDLYFGPKAPKGYEQNWIKTIPGEGFFLLPRFYGPLKPIIDKTWKLNDVERIK